MDLFGVEGSQVVDEVRWVPLQRNSSLALFAKGGVFVAFTLPINQDQCLYKSGMLLCQRNRKPAPRKTPLSFSVASVNVPCLGLNPRTQNLEPYNGSIIQNTQ